MPKYKNGISRFRTQISFEAKVILIKKVISTKGYFEKLLERENLKN
jgi:hypothetical protein